MTKWNVLARASASAAALSFGFCAIAAAASAGDLHGRVQDDISKSALPGAVVSIQGTSISTTAGRDGSFAFADLKPGRYTLAVDYVGYPDKTVAVAIVDGTPVALTIALTRDETIETVTITGQRQAERVAMQVKRSSNAIIDALYANDVGKLPDQNVAEAVRRLPGISILNDQGEGRYAVIRGAAPNLANVTVNGQTAAAPETDGRAIKLDDIPASLIGSLTVHKTLTPDLDANAIAGQLDISTISAFDKGGRFAYGRFSAGHFAMNGKTPMEGDLTGGSVFGSDDQFGIIGAINYSTRPVESQNFGAGKPVWATVGSTTLPDVMELRDYNLTRIRQGGVFNFDWKVSDDFEVFTRMTYSSFSDKETRDRFILTRPTPSTSGTRYVRQRQEDDHTWNFSSGFKRTFGLNTLKVQGTYSEAVKTDPKRDEWTFKSSTTFTGTYDMSEPLYLFTADANAYDASKYNFSALKHENRQAVENLFQVRADYERLVEGLGDGATIKAGFKWTERVKKYDDEVQSFKANKGFTLAMTSFAYDGIAKGYPGATYDGRYTIGPRVNYDAAETYFLTAHGTRACDSSTTGGFYCDVAGSTASSLQGDYRVREDIIAGYLMAEVKFGKLQLIPGVRVEETESSYSAYNSKLAQFLPQTTSYLDAFPGINARYDASDDLVLRGAVTTAIGRPEYTQLVPTLTIDTSTTPNPGTAGNPFVKPLRSINYDLGFEYYLPGQGVIAVSAFYKDISDAIFTSSVSKNLGDVVNGWTLTANSLLSMPQNAGNAEIKGVEVNLQEQFGFLPSPLDGLGASANFAYIDSTMTGVTGRTDTLPMPDQSRTVATAQLFYEKYGFTARLAYSYRSKYLLTVGATKTGLTDGDIYVTQLGQLDGRLSYDLSTSTTMFFEAANINGAAYRTYLGVPSHINENEKYSYSTKLGIQVKL